MFPCLLPSDRVDVSERTQTAVQEAWFNTISDASPYTVRPDASHPVRDLLLDKFLWDVDISSLLIPSLGICVSLRFKRTAHVCGTVP